MTMMLCFVLCHTVVDGRRQMSINTAPSYGMFTPSDDVHSIKCLEGSWEPIAFRYFWDWREEVQFEKYSHRLSVRKWIALRGTCYTYIEIEKSLCFATLEMTVLEDSAVAYISSLSSVPVALQLQFRCHHAATTYMAMATAISMPIVSINAQWCIELCGCCSVLIHSHALAITHT